MKALGAFPCISLTAHPSLRCASSFGNLQFNFILLGVLALLLFLFSVSKFVLTPKLGLSFFVIYVLFVAYALVQELACKGSC